MRIPGIECRPSTGILGKKCIMYQISHHMKWVVSEIFELHFSGNNITPDKIRMGEIATILESFENILFSIIAKSNPKITKDIVTVSLQNITAGSIGLEFISSDTIVVKPAFTEAARAMGTGAGNLPPDSLKYFSQFLSIMKKHQLDAEFKIKNGIDETVATLSYKYTLPQPIYIVGQTTIYGEIVRVGGVDPKVEVRIFSGETLYCPFEKNLAAQLGAALYNILGLEGQARWDPKTGKMIEFKVTGISPYRNTSLVEAFKSLKQVSENAYENIDDVKKYIEKLRGDE